MVLKFKGGLRPHRAGTHAVVSHSLADDPPASASSSATGRRMGYVDEDDVLGLDTGCVWGGTLTAQRIDLPTLPVAVANHTGGLPLDAD